MEFPLCVLGCIHYFRRPLCPPRGTHTGQVLPRTLTPDNFGGRIYRRTIIFRFFRPRTILPLLTRSWTRGASSSPPRFLLDRIGGGERERENRPSIGPGEDKTGGGERGEKSLTGLSRGSAEAHGNTICGSRRVSPRVRSRRFI